VGGGWKGEKNTDCEEKGLNNKGGEKGWSLVCQWAQGTNIRKFTKGKEGRISQQEGEQQRERGAGAIGWPVSVEKY